MPNKLVKKDDVGDAIVDLVKQNCMSTLEQFNEELNDDCEEKLLEAINALS